MKKRKTVSVELSLSTPDREKINRETPFGVAKVVTKRYKYGRFGSASEKRAREFHEFLLHNASGAFYSELERLFIERHQSFNKS